MNKNLLIQVYAIKIGDMICDRYEGSKETTIHYTDEEIVNCVDKLIGKFEELSSSGHI
jgi:hypothetical protein